MVCYSQFGRRRFFFNQLIYTAALEKLYIWEISDNQEKGSKFFREAVDEFKQFLQLPGAVPQWAEYHLSCLYSGAAERVSGSDAATHRSMARAYLVQALKHLIGAQNDKSVIQEKLMKCRLTDPSICQPPRGPEPKICWSVFRLKSGDKEIEELVQKL
jgi:hypothetical protein